MRVAVASDLHFFNTASLKKPEEVPSHLNVAVPMNAADENPLAGLRELVSKDSNCNADVLVISGDITTGADIASLNHAWLEIERLRVTLGCATVIATVGNHDVQSRDAALDPDVMRALKGLVPRFPVADETEARRYWAEGFAVETVDFVRFVTINTASFHGYASEYKHGRVTEPLIRGVRAYLTANGGAAKTNVLVLHHHPLEIEPVRSGDYSAIVDAHLLLDLVGDGSFGPWLVVHGHKHLPCLRYSVGGVAAPAVIFSAGSFAASLHLSIQALTGNQFYVVDLEQPTAGASVRGTFHAWDWVKGTGWAPAREQARPDVGLPRRGGFGCQTTLSELAAHVTAHLQASAEAFVFWEELEVLEPDLRYLIPRDLHALVMTLEASGVKVVPDKGLPYQLSARSAAS